MIFIPGNVPSSKNMTWVCNNRILPIKSVVKWRKEVAPFMLAHKKEFLSLLKYKPPYKIGFQFIRKTKHKFDYVNPLQAIQDEMVKNGWLEDDNADELLPIFLPYKYDKDNPGVEITVL